VSQPIPVYTESGEAVASLSDEDVRDLVRAGRATIVRDRKGNNRRAILLASVSHRLIAESLKSALDSYRGIDRYTYSETVDAKDHRANIVTLKRYNPKTGGFVKWDQGKAARSLPWEASA